MPQISGYEATGLIRQKEQQRTPIIAMTANAMPEDRKKCLAAGMDDYISKPVKVDSLRNCLKHWLNEKSTSLVQPTNKVVNFIADTHIPNHQLHIIDAPTLSALKELMEEEFPTLINSYLEDTPKLMDDIRSAAKVANIEVLVRAAHTLKSSSNNIGAIQLATIAATIEKIGQENQLSQAAALIPSLEIALNQVIKTLKEFE